MLLPLSLLSVFYLLAVIAVCWKKSDLGFWAICISAPLVFILVIGFWPLLSTNGTQPTAESLNDKAKSNRSPNQPRSNTEDPSKEAEGSPTPNAINQASFEPYRPIERSSDGYVQGESCRECHPGNYESWHDSYHRTMTQLADPSIVMGNFDGQSVDTREGAYKLFEEGGVCWGEIPNQVLSGNRVAAPGASRVPLVMTTGSHHMQVYWFPLASGRTLGQFPLVYLKEAERWVPRHSCFLQPPGEPAGIEAGRWNNTCLQCHTTHPKQKLSRDFKFDTDVAEFGISCEACHGPGEDHIDFHRNENTKASIGTDPIVNPDNLSHQASSQTCGNCHSITTHLTSETRNNGHAFRPGKSLEDSRHLYQVNDQSVAELKKRNQDPKEFFDASFWDDGMVRVSGREFNGLIETPCYQKGTMSCISCHSLHQESDDRRDAKQWADDQLAIDMRSDQACLQCHDQGDYGETHTHHSITSTGSRCYNCHMPHTTYGLLKAIRSHTISSPSVASDDIQAGRPNACNLCHLDQTLGWTADHLQENWGISKPELEPIHQQHAAGPLWTLTGDASIRALTAWHFGWEAAQEACDTDWMSRYLMELINDPYDAVRYIGARSLKSIPEYSAIEYDHLANVSERKRMQNQLIEDWQTGAADRQREDRSEVLIEDGKISQRLWDSLRKLRDDTPIFLDE
ncbi:MAG: multiheme c-type cytochrome [Rubripirellula sp.]